jgi:hypothetical protein
MNIKIKIGSTMLEFDGRDFKEVVKEAAAFSQGNKCGCCKSSNVVLDYRYAVAKQGKNAGQGFDYYSIKCLDCWARAQLGEYKTGGFFLKMWEKYEKPTQNNAPQRNATQQDEAIDFEDIES